MIVFLSDLHLMDGTAGENNLPVSAFVGTFEDIAEHARNADAQQIKIVLLGDTFDLIASAAWLDHDPARPWDWSDFSRPAKAADAVLAGIIAQHQATCDFLRSVQQDPAAHRFPCRVEITFVPANHDRLCNLPALARRVRSALGIQPDSPALFENAFADAEHAVFARHGHEWDGWNFEGSKALSQPQYVAVTPEEYMQPPIGDPLTTELAARLPGDVYAALAGKCSEEQRERVRDRMCDVFDVRPMASLVPWLTYHADREVPVVWKAINGVVEAIVRRLDKETPFVTAWLKKHHNRLHPFDGAGALHYLMELLEHAGIDPLSKTLPIAQSAASLLPGDNHAAKALDDLRRVDAGHPTLKNVVRFIIYGHTHRPEQRALAVLPQDRQCMYLNTGTWRPTYEQCLDKNSFATWKTLTYTILYRPGEKVSGQAIAQPQFEVWTGGLQET